MKIISQKSIRDLGISPKVCCDWIRDCDTAFDHVFGDGTNHVKGFKYFSEYHDYNEISEVLAGRDPGRKSQVQRIIDYNYGLALHDVVYAAKIYKLMKDVECPEFEIVKETDKFWV